MLELGIMVSHLDSLTIDDYCIGENQEELTFEVFNWLCQEVSSLKVHAVY